MPPLQCAAGYSVLQQSGNLCAMFGSLGSSTQGNRILDGIGIGSVSECLPHSLPIGIVHHPRHCLRYILSSVGIGYVKHIAEFSPAGMTVQQGNAVTASVDPAQRLVIPVVDTGHSGGIGPLAENQKLVREGVIVSISGGIQKSLPRFTVLGNLPDQGPGQGAYILVGGHSSFLSYRSGSIRFIFRTLDSCRSNRGDSSVNPKLST